VGIPGLLVLQVHQEILVLQVLEPAQVALHHLLGPIGLAQLVIPVVRVLREVGQGQGRLAVQEILEILDLQEAPVLLEIPVLLEEQLLPQLLVLHIVLQELLVAMQALGVPVVPVVPPGAVGVLEILEIQEQMVLADPVGLLVWLGILETKALLVMLET
jgi:hypothetical protein